nr:carbohydrate ABC transporter permease [Lachnospiraceae bacterium]
MAATAAYQKKKNKIKPFDIVNCVIFIIISILILLPIWKVLVDSFDATSGYGLSFLPKRFTLEAYKMALSRADLYRPFLISVLVTLSGTFVGLMLSTLGAYVLIQWEMPGRNFLSYFLLFTMLFSGGMIPTYIVMMNLHLT